MTDEEWTMNMPECHLAGFVGVQDDIEGEDAEDEGSEEGDEDDLVGMHDEDVDAEEAEMDS